MTIFLCFFPEFLVCVYWNFNSVFFCLIWEKICTFFGCLKKKNGKKAFKFSTFFSLKIVCEVQFNQKQCIDFDKLIRLSFVMLMRVCRCIIFRSQYAHVASVFETISCIHNNYYTKFEKWCFISIPYFVWNHIEQMTENEMTTYQILYGAITIIII